MNQKIIYSSALLVGLGSPQAFAHKEKAHTPQKPNIIFIMCDDMGYGDLGCYGQPYISTPNIDNMAREGMRFTQAYAGSPVSAPSRASLMTGQHTGHCEVRGNKEYWTQASTVMYGDNKEFSVVGQHPYDPEHVILPEIMKDNGYTTGMFGKWAGGYEGSASTPDKRGIDEYYGYICQFQAHLYYPNFLNRYSPSLGDTGVVRVVMEENIKYPMYGPDYHKRTQYSADLIHQKAMEWIEKQDGEQPFFGIFTYTLPHAELVQPEDSILNHYKTQFADDKAFGGQKGSRYNAITHVHAQFAGMITRLDYYVGEVLKKLEEKGFDENTIVIFTSDNGPHEEGGADPTFFGRDGKLRGLKRQCYEGAIRVPHVLSGFPDNLYSKVAPRYKSDQSIQVPSIFFPSRLKEWIYSFFSSPPLIITSPSGKCKTILRNTGLFTEKPPTPGISGNKPILAKTYHAPIDPKSSLPGKPFTRLLYCSFSIRRITCCAL